MRYLAKVKYDGSNFFGFQVQDNHRTVQGEIQKALKIIEKETVKIHASGRTDRGVHALGQYFHFDSKLTKINWLNAFNSNLPDDIYILDCIPVDEEFHARYHAKRKTYTYKINIGQFDPLSRNYILQYCKPLNIDKMELESKKLIGTMDYINFTKLEYKKNTIRTIYSIDFNLDNDVLSITFTGSGFLRYQIRIMIGVLIYIGKGKEIDINSLLTLDSKLPIQKTIEPNGLYLVDVEYE